MRSLIVILAVLASGCAATVPTWQLELNNLNRQWVDEDLVTTKPEQTEFTDVRQQFMTVGICKL